MYNKFFIHISEYFDLIKKLTVVGKFCYETSLKSTHTQTKTGLIFILKLDQYFSYKMY